MCAVSCLQLRCVCGSFCFDLYSCLQICRRLCLSRAAATATAQYHLSPFCINSTGKAVSVAPVPGVATPELTAVLTQLLAAQAAERIEEGPAEVRMEDSNL